MRVCDRVFACPGVRAQVIEAKRTTELRPMNGALPWATAYVAFRAEHHFDAAAPADAAPPPLADAPGPVLPLLEAPLPVLPVADLIPLCPPEPRKRKAAPKPKAPRQPKRVAIVDLRSREPPLARLSSRKVCREEDIVAGEKESFLRAVSESQAFGGVLDHVIRPATAEHLRWSAFRRFVGFLQPARPVTCCEVPCRVAAIHSRVQSPLPARSRCRCSHRCPAVAAATVVTTAGAHI